MTGLPLQTWRAASTPLHAVAISVTMVRLYHRYKKCKLWWDDCWALVSLIFDSIFMVMPFFRDNISGPLILRKKRIVVFWISALFFPLAVWAARISIGMSIARLVPPKTKARWLLYAMNIIFVLMCFAVLFHKVGWCTQNTSWHNTLQVQCYLGSGVGILNLCTDLLADTCLVAIPLRMLWGVKLPSKQRRLILSIFASTVLSSMAGTVYTIFVFEAQAHHLRWAYYIGLITHIKAAMTLLVCNLLVVVTYLYCLFWREEGDDSITELSETRSKPTGTPPPTTHITLTEISDMRSFETYSSPSNPSVPSTMSNASASKIKTEASES